ncbi:MAG: hypothetical protein VX589_00715 [Myxococcota bacterium]|nr:hypothetical protein [Myxococcota bacterium]
MRQRIALVGLLVLSSSACENDQPESVPTSSDCRTTGQGCEVGLVCQATAAGTFACLPDTRRTGGTPSRQGAGTTSVTQSSAGAPIDQESAGMPVDDSSGGSAGGQNSGGTPSMAGLGGTIIYERSGGTANGQNAGGTPSMAGSVGTIAYEGSGGTSGGQSAGGIPVHEASGGTAGPDESGGTAINNVSGGLGDTEGAGGTAGPNESGGTTINDVSGGRGDTGGVGGTAGPENAGGTTINDVSGGLGDTGGAGGTAGPENAGGTTINDGLGSSAGTAGAGGSAGTDGAGGSAGTADASDSAGTADAGGRAGTASLGGAAGHAGGSDPAGGQGAGGTTVNDEAAGDPVGQGAGGHLDPLAQEGACDGQADGHILAVGEYGACTFTDNCIESGEQVRTNAVCRDGTEVDEAEVQVCERDTEGTVVVRPNFGDCVGFEDLCDLTGEQSRPIGVCRAGVVTEELETQACDRTDPGVVITADRAAVCMTEAGGALELPGGRLVVPADALIDPMEVYLERVDHAVLDISGLTVFGPIFRAGPRDTVLTRPATISANFDGERGRADLFIESGRDFHRLGGRVLADEVQGEVEQFGAFLVADGVDFSLDADRNCVDLRTIEGRAQQPGTVALFFTVDDCSGRPLSGLPVDEFDIFEGDVHLNEDAPRRILPQDGTQAFVSLVLDLSGSTRPHLDEIVASTSAFVRQLTAEGNTAIQIGIELFAGDQSLTRWQAPNLQPETVLERLERIDDFNPDEATVANLNGAIIQGLDRLAADAEAFRDRNNGGAFTTEHLVVLTGSADTAGFVDNESVQARIATSSAEVTIVGIKSPPFDADALHAFSVQTMTAPDPAHLDRELQRLARRMAGQWARTYLLAFCTAQQAGEHTVTIRLAGADNQRTAQFSFTADSIAAPGCDDALFDNQCADKQCGGLGCGFCDDRTAQCTQTDQCQSYCDTDPVTTAVAVADRCEHPNPQGYAQYCEQDISTRCDGNCTDLAHDPENCGGCGFGCGPNVVGIVNGVGTLGESCRASVCQCGPGWYGAACDQTRCGDGFVTPDEACDDGNVDDTDACTNTCELGAAPAPTWVQVASLPPEFSQTHHSFAFSLDGYGYIVTGNSRTGVRDDFYRYDAIDNTWTELDRFPGPARGFAIGDTWAGKAYLGFGSDSQSLFNDLWVFDPTDMSWTELAACPCAGRRHPAFIAQNGQILVGLGNNTQGNLKDWWAYDIASNTWAQKDDFPSLPRHHPYQFGIGDYVYTGFGHGAGIFNNWFRYDLVEETWTEVASLPAEGRVAGTQFSYDGIGYVLSGDGDNHRSMETGEFWAYDPTSNAWEALPPHPEGSRWAPASFVVDGEVYIINGTSFFRYVSDIYKFDLRSMQSSQ